MNHFAVHKVHQRGSSPTHVKCRKVTNHHSCIQQSWKYQEQSFCRNRAETIGDFFFLLSLPLPLFLIRDRPFSKKNFHFHMDGGGIKRPLSSIPFKCLLLCSSFQSLQTARILWRLVFSKSIRPQTWLLSKYYLMMLVLSSERTSSRRFNTQLYQRVKDRKYPQHYQ